MKKVKYTIVSVAILIISVLVIILSILDLLNITNRNITMPIISLLGGIVCISTGYSLYIKNKKGEATFLILSGIFVISVFVITTFF